MTLGPKSLLRLRLLLLLLLPPPTRAARSLPPAPQTLTLTVAGPEPPRRPVTPPPEASPTCWMCQLAPMTAPPPAAEAPDGVEIRDVWAANLEEEFAMIREVVDAYPYVAMDTEFPGVVVKPVAAFRCQSEKNYAVLAGNVNVLKLIQLGLALSDGTGALPPCGAGGRACIWQFNFRGFDPLTDPSNADSIDLLRRSGIDFDRFVAEGVDPTRFGELMMSSGILLNADVQWITFHSGHDFGYLLRVLTGRNMPDTLEEFLELTETFFPVLYDVKHIMKYCGNSGGLYGGLSKLAEQLKVDRVGTSHQAGSDSLLTLQCFRKLEALYLQQSVNKYAGVLFGLIPEAGENNLSPLPLE